MVHKAGVLKETVERDDGHLATAIGLGSKSVVASRA